MPSLSNLLEAVAKPSFRISQAGRPSKADSQATGVSLASSKKRRPELPSEERLPCSTSAAYCFLSMPFGAIDLVIRCADPAHSHHAQWRGPPTEHAAPRRRQAGSPDSVPRRARDVSGHPGDDRLDCQVARLPARIPRGQSFGRPQDPLGRRRMVEAPLGHSHPSGHPPLLGPSRVLGATLWTGEGRPRRARSGPPTCDVRRRAG